MIEIPLHLVDVVAFADPAGSKTEVKKVQARSAIAVIAGDSRDRVYTLDVWSARTTTDKFVEKMFELFATWRPRVFGVEANAMQSLFADMLRRECKLRGTPIPFVNVTQPTRVDKPFRNRSALQGIINEGRFLMLKDAQVEARNELESHPMCAQFDMVDSVASAVGLLRRTPRETAKAGELLSMRRHLLASGMTPRQIDDYMATRSVADREIPPRPES